jgi:hypothetical protein
VVAPLIVTKAVGLGLEVAERINLGQLLRRIAASRRKGNQYIVAGFLRRFLDADAAAENYEVRQRNMFTAQLIGIELRLDVLECLQNLRQLRRVVDLPVLLGLEANSGTVRAAAFVGTPESGG